MHIEDLKKQFPQVSFYKLKSSPESKDYLQLSNPEDLFELSSKIAYYEYDTDPELARNTAINLLVKTLDLPRFEDIDFCSYLEEHITSKLNKLLSFPIQTILELYGLDINVSYQTPMHWWDTNEQNEAIAEVNVVFQSYRRKKDEITNLEIQKEKEVDAFIDSYKERYLNEATKSGKEEILREVQLYVKEKFGLSAQSREKLTKISLKLRYEKG
jgi:hypothetical protein